uniref:Uncharacterized protein n=1 Tax=uncultured Actinomycetes bacterium TaxID=152507 RepID=A0A871YDQ9_9ACTN|nr:hypothetical protein HULAa32G3_00028 [uncultured Actinomycetes bacterium]
MSRANLHPLSGTWKVRFHLDEEPNIWRIEFYDPATWCQTIPVPIRFLNRSHALQWLFRTVAEESLWVEKYLDWFQCEVESESVGQLVLNLQFASRRSEDDWSPWYYSSYQVKGCYEIKLYNQN